MEFNELCPALIDRWMASGDLPHFRRLHAGSAVYVTEADELEAPNLEPWIQWYSLHTGLPFERHGVFRLTDGATAPHESVWDRLVSGGHRVMNFSSMNCRPLRAVGSVFLPDPWSDGSAAWPPELGLFHRLLAKAIQEQAGAKWNANELLQSLGFLLSHGLRARTVLAIARQLLAERLAKLPRQWQRVELMDRLLLDVFRHQYRAHRPAFATFFSNSTAHLQHAYWRYLEPERFSEPVSDSERAAFGDAVKFGYRAMDACLGELMALAAQHGARVMFATALSQQAYTAFEGKGGRHYYRPRDVKSLLGRLGVEPLQFQPIMAQQYIATFASEADSRQARDRLQRLRLGDKPVFDVFDGNISSELTFGSHIYTALSRTQQVTLISDGAAETLPFFDHFYELEATKSGRHHPEGCFWVQADRPRSESGRVSILDVAPTILSHFRAGTDGLPGRALPV